MSAAPEFRLHPVPAQIRERTDSPPPLDAATEAEVARIWEAERVRRGPSLFNGRIFSFDAPPGDGTGEWAGRFVEYRLFIAQLKEPSLFGVLGVRALAVTGFLRCPDGIVFGRRSPTLMQDRGCWELVPAGGVDLPARDGKGEIDPRRQLAEELGEELGLPETALGEVHPFAHLEDEAHHVFDLAFMAFLPFSGVEIQAARARLEKPEHEEIAIISPDGLTAFLQGPGATLAPASRRLLVEAGFSEGR
jgi:hypothetical protein